MRRLKAVFVGMSVALLIVPIWLPTSASPPRHCKGLDIYFYGRPYDAFLALNASEIDIMCYNLHHAEWLLAVPNPDIQIAAHEGFEYYGWDLNNNYTVPTYPGVRNPLNVREFRQALAHAINKTSIIASYVNWGTVEFGHRIDVPIPYPQRYWWNESVTGENYPYEYNITQGNALLDNAGFDDWDDDGIRNYPTGWPGRPGRPNLDPLKIYVRSDSKPWVKSMGAFMCEGLAYLDIPWHRFEIDNSRAFSPVFLEHDYHIYTSIWTVKKWQPLYWFPMFHSMFWYAGGPNYVTGLNESGLPNYPDLDKHLEEAYYTTNVESAIASCKRCQGIFVEECMSITLLSPISYMAYSRYLVGVVNMDGYGINNKYTYLNAYKVDNPNTPKDESQEPIKIGLPNAPIMLNPLYCSTCALAPDVMYSAWQVLDGTVYTHLMNEEPYLVAVDNPWVAQDWEVSTWYDPQDGLNKTKVTYWLRKDVVWKDPMTCVPGSNFTAHDVEFSIWYIYAFDDGWQWHDVMDVHHTKIVDDFTIEVCFDVLSCWAVDWISEQMPLLPKYELLDLLCGEECAVIEITEPIPPSTKMIFTEDQVIQVINGTKYPEGIPLEEGVDYEIFATGPPDYCHSEIHWLRSLDPGEWVVVCYWTPKLDPHGYYLAGLAWSQTMYSIGTYCPTGMMAGVGGWSSFVDNPTHFLGAPPLGEIDWRWIWEPGPKPRSGYYKIDIYDVVKATAAYCHRGDGPSDPKWNPGADIDATDLCHVGIYDVVTITGKYGRRFGSPP